MRLDSHQSFTVAHPPEHFAPILARNRFEGSICVADSPAGLEFGRYDFVRGVILPAGEPRLDEWQRDAKFRGVWSAPGIEAAVLEQLAARDIPLDLHVGAGEWDEIVRVSAAGVRVAVVHLGAPAIEEWVRGLEVAAALLNVVWKLSGHPRAHVQSAMTALGPRRLMFGSGWPFGLPDTGWKQTLAAFTQSLGAQSIETREELLGGTAARFYGIPS